MQNISLKTPPQKEAFGRHYWKFVFFLAHSKDTQFAPINGEKERKQTVAMIAIACYIICLLDLFELSLKTKGPFLELFAMNDKSILYVYFILYAM